MEFSCMDYIHAWNSLGGLPNQRIRPRSPTLQADSLPAEPQGKPKNSGVGSLSLLQWIFLTQESNWGLLHCKQIFYQLSYQESPWLELIWRHKIKIMLLKTLIESQIKFDLNITSQHIKKSLLDSLKVKMYKMCIKYFFLIQNMSISFLEGLLP